MKSVNITSWAAWKALISAKGLLPQYVESPDRYDIFAVELSVSWEFSILKDGGSDVTDFEANYKSIYNKPLEVKAGAGRPQRVAASPQPINTIQHWKGVKLTLPQGQQSAYIDVSFPSLVYLKGAIMYCLDDDVDHDDHLSLDVLYGANDLMILPGILDHCYIISGNTVNFESSEAMAIAPELKLRLTLHDDDEAGAGASRTIFIIMEYFV